jgi:hypothetical protein
MLLPWGYVKYVDNYQILEYYVYRVYFTDFAIPRLFDLNNNNNNGGIIK